MFSVITNIYNKKTKGHTLMEFFTAPGKLKVFFFFFFFGNWKCSMCAPRVTRHTSIRYSTSCHIGVNMGASMFFTAAMIRAFRSARSRGHGGTNTFARNARRTVTTDLHVWYSNTQNDFFPGAAIFSLHTLASPSGRNVNYDEKQLTGKENFELFLLSVQVS